MVLAYWNIGKQIYESCGEQERAGYGQGLLKYLSQKLTAEFGKGFDTSNLRNMRIFYRAFMNCDTLCHELSWSHYRLIMKINDEKVRNFYMEECAKSGWSVRQLQRQINTMYYQRILASQDKKSVAEMMNDGDNPPIGILLCADKSDTLVRYTLPENNRQIYAAKYLPYMPSEEELRRELRLDDFERLD